MAETAFVKVAEVGEPGEMKYAEVGDDPVLLANVDWIMSLRPVAF